MLEHVIQAAMPDEGNEVAFDAMVRTCWGEARDQPDEGIAAVAFDILNRAGHPSWWGADVWHVCHHAYQYSCWNVSDPNFPKMVALDPDSTEYRKIAAVVEKVVAGAIPDPCASIGGSTHYKVFGTSASWDKAAEGKPSVRIGAHVFFNLGPSA